MSGHEDILHGGKNWRDILGELPPVPHVNRTQSWSIGENILTVLPTSNATSTYSNQKFISIRSLLEPVISHADFYFRTDFFSRKTEGINSTPVLKEKSPKSFSNFSLKVTHPITEGVFLCLIFLLIVVSFSGVTIHIRLSVHAREHETTPLTIF